MKMMIRSSSPSSIRDETTEPSFSKDFRAAVWSVSMVLTTYTLFFKTQPCNTLIIQLLLIIIQLLLLVNQTRVYSVRIYHNTIQLYNHFENYEKY